MSCYWIRLNGRVPADQIAPHTDPTWETLADGGIGEVSFAVALSTKAQHPLLRAGVKVEVMLGAQAVATATMSDPDRTTWEIKAQGLAAASRKIAAVNSLGDMTRDVGQVLLNVISNGSWQVTNPDGVGNGKIVTGDATTPQYVGDLMDSLAAQEGMRWGVDGRGRLYMRANPTSPTMLIEPEQAAFGTTDEGRATQVVARYQTTTGAYATRTYPPTLPAGTPVIQEITEDLIKRGQMTEAQVDAILAGYFALGKASEGWTNGVTLGVDEVTRRGAPVALPLVTAGRDMARATGLAASFTTQAPWLDVVIGKTRYTAGEDVIYLEPVGTAPRNLADVIAAA